jgi:hypothetical protein
MRIRSTERFGDLPASRVSSTSANLGDITIRDSEIIVGEDKTVEFYSKNGSSNVNIGSIGSTGFRPAVVTDSTLPTPEAGGEGLMLYNTTSKTYGVWDGTSWESDNQLTAIASDVLPTGHTVVINPNGTVGLAVPISLGTPVPYSGANASTAMAATFDSNSNRVVIAYNDASTLDHGYAVVGTVSGTSITFGTPILFDNTAVEYISATFDSNSNNVVIAYKDTITTFGNAIVGTVSGTTISFGTPVQFESARSDHISATFDSNSNKVVIAYTDYTNGQLGTAIVGTVLGTAISFGTAVLFDNTRTNAISTSFDSNSNKVVIAYSDLDNTNYGTAVVGTVVGDVISFGPPSVFESTNTATIYSVFESALNKVVIAYQGNFAVNAHGNAVVGTVSGTSISFGTPNKFNLAITVVAGIAYDSDSETVVISYRDGGNSAYGTAITGSVSGTSISYGTPLVFNSDSTSPGGDATIFDSTANKVVISYKDGVTNVGETVVLQAAWNPLTNDNFLGFSNNNYATGSTANIQTVGSVNNDQIGLTSGRKYYVQLDGTIGVTAASPSVYAGLALSDTKILVKG